MRRGLLVLVGGAWIVALCAGSYFTTDDHVFFAQARELPFGWSFLSAPIYDHFSPWHRLADQVVSSLTHQGWWLAMVISLGWYAGCVAVFALVVRRLGGHWVFVAVFALSPVWVQATQWWALSAQIYPELFFALLAVYLTLTSRLVLAVFAYALALCAFIKALLVLPVVLVLGRDRRFAGAVGVVTAVYLVVISGDRYYRFIGAGPRPGFVLWLKYLVAGWGEGVAPLALNGSVGRQLGLGVLIVVVANLSVFLLVARFRDRVWVLAGVVVVGGLVLSGGARLGTEGVETVALDPRYNAEGAIALLLAAAYVLRDRRLSPPWLLVVPVAFTVIAGLRLERDWIGPVHRRYFDAFADSYHGQKIVDGVVPQVIVAAQIAPYNAFSRVLPDREPSVSVGAPDASSYLDGSGRVRPVRLRRVGSGSCPVVDVGIEGGDDLVVATISGRGPATVVANSGVPGGPVVSGFHLAPTLTTSLPRLPYRAVVGVGPVRTLTVKGDCASVTVDRFPIPRGTS